MNGPFTRSPIAAPKDLLVAAGVPHPLAMPAVIGAFGGAVALAVRRVLRVN
jgi:hypothetical protein